MRSADDGRLTGGRGGAQMRRACLAPSAEDYAALIATAGRVKALDYVMHVRPRVASAPGQPARGVWQAQCAVWREQSNHLHLSFTFAASRVFWHVDCDLVPATVGIALSRWGLHRCSVHRTR